MNHVALCGRLTSDPEIRVSNGEKQTSIARYTLAVDRRIKTENGQNADFINCLSFGKTAEFIEKYFKKGTKIIAQGTIQTGSYTNKDGQKVYTTDVLVNEVEFAESKSSGTTTSAVPTSTPTSAPVNTPALDGFMNIPSGLEDEGLPF